MNNSSEEILKIIDSLPPEFRDAIKEADIQTKVQEIGKRYALHIDAMTALYSDVNLFIYGITKPSDFEESLKNISGVTADQVHLIAVDVNEQILKYIRQKVQNKIEEGIKEKEEQEGLDRELSALKDISKDEAIEDKMDNIASNETEVLKKAGVIISDGPNMTLDTTETLNRSEVVSGIENPPEAKVYKLNVIESKLANPQVSPSQTTDHSLQKISTPTAPVVKKVDPYRETV